MPTQIRGGTIVRGDAQASRAKDVAIAVLIVCLFLVSVPDRESFANLVRSWPGSPWGKTVSWLQLKAGAASYQSFGVVSLVRFRQKWYLGVLRCWLPVPNFREVSAAQIVTTATALVYGAGLLVPGYFMRSHFMLSPLSLHRRPWTILTSGLLTTSFIQLLSVHTRKKGGAQLCRSNTGQQLLNDASRRMFCCRVLDAAEGLTGPCTVDGWQLVCMFVAGAAAGNLAAALVLQGWHRSRSFFLHGPWGGIAAVVASSLVRKTTASPTLWLGGLLLTPLQMLLATLLLDAAHHIGLGANPGLAATLSHTLAGAALGALAAAFLPPVAACVRTPAAILDHARYQAASQPLHLT